VITVLDGEYPINLRMVHDRPPALFVRGELDARDERSVAVVAVHTVVASPISSGRFMPLCSISAATVHTSSSDAVIGPERPTRSASRSSTRIRRPLRWLRVPQRRRGA